MEHRRRVLDPVDTSTFFSCFSTTSHKQAHEPCRESQTQTDGRCHVHAVAGFCPRRACAWFGRCLGERRLQTSDLPAQTTQSHIHTFAHSVGGTMGETFQTRHSPPLAATQHTTPAEPVKAPTIRASPPPRLWPVSTTLRSLIDFT